MTARRAAAALALAALVALAARVEPASACSCVAGDPRAAVAGADAAFVGALIEKRESPGATSSLDQATYVFEVAVAVKGDLGETVEVRSAVSGASCGIEADVGEEIGLLLYREGDAWTSSLCRQLPPDELRAAARPLPRPDGSGPPALVIGGKFGGARTVVLDSKARTLAYGTGAGTVYDLSLCPGGRTVAEVGNEPGGWRVIVRDLATARLRWGVALPYSARRFSPLGIACGTRGVDVFLSTVGVEWKPASSVLVRLTVGRVRVLHRGHGWSCGFGQRQAFITERTRLLGVPIAGGAARLLALVPRGAGPFVPSPDGRRLAGLLYDHKRGGGVVLVDLRARPRARVLRVPGANAGGELVWLDARRFVFLPGGGPAVARVYDTSFRLQATFTGWDATDSVVARGRAYGVRRGELIAAALPRGPVEAVRRLPGPETYALAARASLLGARGSAVEPEPEPDRALPQGRWIALAGTALAALAAVAVVAARRPLRPSRR